MEQEKQQELFFKLSIFEQQARQLQQQIEAVEKGVNELSSLNLGLDGLRESTGKEIMAPLGRGIFVSSTINSENLLVDVGGKNLVKKSIPETKEIIEQQIKKLFKVKEELNENLGKVGEEMTKMLEQFQKEEA